MGYEKEIQDAFSRLKERGLSTFAGEVVSVDKSKGTCTVNAGDIKYTEVRLAALIDENDNKFYLYPAIGSSVLVSPINEDELQLYVEAYSEVEQFKFKTGSSILDVDANGFLIKCQDEGLRELMLDFIKACKNMKFTTNNGPTIKLINEPEFVALESRFKTLLKAN